MGSTRPLLAFDGGLVERRSEPPRLRLSARTPAAARAKRSPSPFRLPSPREKHRSFGLLRSRVSATSSEKSTGRRCKRDDRGARELPADRGARTQGVWAEPTVELLQDVCCCAVRRGTTQPRGGNTRGSRGGASCTTPRASSPSAARAGVFINTSLDRAYSRSARRAPDAAGWAHTRLAGVRPARRPSTPSVPGHAGLAQLASPTRGLLRAARACA